MNRIAVYPGTFDPITHGHTDIIARAASLFDQLIVGVVEENTKNSLFASVEREELVKAVLKPYENVKVIRFKGLLIDFAKQQNARVIIRGLRNTTDYNYEIQMAGINKVLAPAVETVFLRASEEFAAISSTLVREIARLAGNVQPFVTEVVARALENKLNNA